MRTQVEIVLPRLHEGQQRVIREAKRWNTLRCGRRFGKTLLGEQLIIEKPLKGLPVAWFAPTYKMLSEVWRDILNMLHPMASLIQVDKKERRITMPGGGFIDFWSLDSENTVRGRKYARAIIDEAAYVRGLEEVWFRVIRPTLTDFRGDAWFFSTPKEAHDFFNGVLFARGQQKSGSWKSWSMPTIANPHIDPEEVEEAREYMPEAAWRQEYLGEPAESAESPFGWNFIEKACCLDSPLAGKPDVWGVDLAKSVDYTVAIALDRDGNCVAFQRWQSDWRNTTRRLDVMLRNAPSLVDSSGVGDPIVESLQAKNPLVQGFKFTSTSRQAILEGLAMALQRGEVRVPSDVIEDELKSFRYDYSRGRVRYAAPNSIHDDCVMALALAVHARHSRPATVTLEVEDASIGSSEFYDDDDWDL